ncbi:MAG TPA: metalloregulator ArsR/SmtB family transcription factor [Nitrospira sp.]|nr:metalloregulator ArsR/SmtB family transcription factor [Nitrospira sp.]
MYKKAMQGVTGKNRGKVAAVFSALGDETRLEILAQLRGGERCVCELTEAIETGQSRLSFHLKVLKEAGLIKDRPEGRWIYYSIHADAMEELEDMVRLLREGGKALRGTSRC